MEDEIVSVRSLAITEARPIGKKSEHNSSTRILIKNGIIVNDDHQFEADVYIEDGIIQDVSKHCVVPAGTKIIDAKGNLVMPGGIDCHTHFKFPSAPAPIDDFYSGTRAALAGGTTTIMDFVIAPGPSSLLEKYRQYRLLADPSVCCDYALHMGITEWTPNTASEMEILTREHGVNSYKIFMTYEGLQMPDKMILEILSVCKKIGAIALFHAENGDIVKRNQQELLKLGITGPEGHVYSRPEEVEAEATFRAIVMAKSVQCPIYIVHVMSKSAGDIIAKKRQEGCLVYGEVVAAALGTDGRKYFDPDYDVAAGHVMSPPLNTDPTTKTYLMQLLGSGSLQTTGSDNCTFTKAQKRHGLQNFTKIPNGVNGVEHRLSVIWEKGVMSGILNPCEFVAITSTNAAKIFNLYPKKGTIMVGSDADILIWDPTHSFTVSAETHYHQGDYNIFEGMKLRGAPVVVIACGKVVYDNGDLKVTQGQGEYLDTPPFAPYVFSYLKDQEMYPKINREVEGTSSTPVTSPLSHFNSSSSVKSKEFHSRPPTFGGTRNLQDSSFSLSGAQIDDDKGQRSGIRVKAPPGGHSDGIF